MSEQQQKKNPREEFLRYVRKAADEFSDAVPVSVPKSEVVRAMDRVVAAIRAMAAKNARLYECSPASVGRAVALCALTGLMPGGALPEVDLIPRRNKSGTTLDWQIGWRGYKALAAKAGCRVSPPVAVYDGDLFEWEEGFDRRLVHHPDPTAGGYGTWDALVGVYVIVAFRDGSRDWLFMPRALIEARRAKSQSWKDNEGPWIDWPIEMAQKTAVRYAGQRGLLQFEVEGSFAAGEDGKHDIIEAEPAKRPTALPDYNPLGQDEDEVPPEREVVRVGALDQLEKEAQQEKTPPPNEPASEPPLAWENVGEKRAPATNPNHDARRLFEKLTAGHPGADEILAPASLQSMKDALKGGLAISRISDERLNAALHAGEQIGWWHRMGDQFIPGPPPASATEG
jgi:phage RecT family recombinase